MRLFGTDGIRFLVERDETSSELLYSPFFISCVAYAAAQVLEKGRYIVVWDTRATSRHIAYIFSATLSSFGFTTLLGGVLPTPSVSSLIISLGLSGGFSISASHNPPQFNGLKFFLKSGMKADENTERIIEERFEDVQRKCAEWCELGQGCEISEIRDISDFAFGSYVSYVESLFPKNFLRGIKVVLDCSNGATYEVAPYIFSLFSAGVDVIGNTPDGRNINVGVGSENPHLALSKDADFKIIFDGDGDRVLIGDRYGNLYDGDHILSLLARFMKENGSLRNAVVGTILSNKALEDFVVRELGVRFERVPVGDRNIAYKMKEIGSNLGGEESGHIIMFDVVPTGDGIIVALQTILYVLKSGKEIKDLVITKYHQAKGKLKISQREDLSSDKFSFLKKISCEIERLGGRSVIRYSGTEPVLRVMVEHPDRDTAEKYKDILIEELSKVLRVQ